jgi:hypothetical protein
VHRPIIALGLLAAAAYFATDAEAAQQAEPEAGDPNAGTWLDSLTDWLPDMGIGTPRGERNNNPGNIRLSATRWQGQVDGTDPAFVTFDTPESGIRALAKLLKNYQTIHGLRTVRGIINRYAPPSENNTSAYVAAVSAALGVSPDAAIDLNNAGTLQQLVAAVITHENGRNTYAASTIAAGVALA